MQSNANANSIEQVVVNYQLNMLMMANSFTQSQQAVMIAYLQSATARSVIKGNVIGQLTAPEPHTVEQSIAERSGTLNTTHPFVSVNHNSPATNYSDTVRLPPPQPFDRLSGAVTVNNINQITSERIAVNAVVEDGLVVATSEPGEQEFDQNLLLDPTLDTTNVEEFVQAFVTVLAEKTGYPIEMLEPKLDLETDLGIDSIKRIEILTTYRKMLPAHIQPKLESSVEEVAGVRTLEEISVWIRNILGDLAE